MGPIELVFGVMLILFGIVGVVRGYAKELGITTLLLLCLLVIALLETRFAGPFNSAIRFLIDQGAQQQVTAKYVTFVAFLTLVVFISYQGETLSFPGSGRSVGFSAGAGLLNGYLYAGSVWYYLAQAGWPLLNVVEPYTTLYQAIYRVLPPALLSWPYLLALVAFLLLVRVWR